MPVNILDLARPEPSEEEFEHVHYAERMTIWDHVFRAVGLVAGLVLYAVVGMVTSTLLHLYGLAALVVMLAWPLAFVPLILLITEVIQPLGRLIRQRAERIEGCND